MTSSTETLVSCPNCKNETAWQIWNSININVSPELRDGIISGEIFDFHCPTCGFETRLVYPVLYNDMENHFWVQLILDPEEAKNFHVDMPAITNKVMAGYRSRVVTTPNELLDKIHMFENGLDDRIVECMKLIAFRNLSQQNVKVRFGEIYFVKPIKNAVGAIESLEFFLDTEEQTGTFPMDYENYTLWQSELALPENQVDEWLQVDHAYAMELFDALIKKQSSADDPAA